MTEEKKEMLTIFRKHYDNFKMRCDIDNSTLRHVIFPAMQEYAKLNIPDIIERSEQSFCPNCHVFHGNEDWDGYCSKSCWDGIEAK